MAAREPENAPGGPRLSELLRRLQPEILTEWEQAVRQLPIARDLARLALIDHIPPILDPEGRIVGGVATLIDITDRKRAEEERERLLAELNVAV
ncbi:MAG: hypothetical protein IT372_16185 [Polyangiaceae bacterium]|nr:hypothetical protein [Polyangiaceae bacterium]